MGTSVSPWARVGRRGAGRLPHARRLRAAAQAAGRGFHSSTFRLNVSTFGAKCWVLFMVSVMKTAQVELESGRGLPLVHFSAQRKHLL